MQWGHREPSPAEGPQGMAWGTSTPKEPAQSPSAPQRGTPQTQAEGASIPKELPKPPEGTPSPGTGCQHPKPLKAPPQFFAESASTPKESPQAHKVPP